MQALVSGLAAFHPEIVAKIKAIMKEAYTDSLDFLSIRAKETWDFTIG
jgi:hypothetical protein